MVIIRMTKRIIRQRNANNVTTVLVLTLAMGLAVVAHIRAVMVIMMIMMMMMMAATMAGTTW